MAEFNQENKLYTRKAGPADGEMMIYQVVWFPEQKYRAWIKPVFCLPYWILDGVFAEYMVTVLGEKTTRGTYEAVEYKLNAGNNPPGIDELEFDD